jgi:hypothetical protein
LEKLEISRPLNLENIQTLGNLTNLKILKLNYCLFSDISFVQYLQKLRVFDCENSGIDYCDLSSLQFCKELNVVNFSGCWGVRKDISFVHSLKDIRVYGYEI